MPFIVRTRTGMAAEQLGKGLQGGLLAYMQGAKMARDAAVQGQKIALQQAANARAEAADARAEAKFDEWTAGAPARKLQRDVATMRATEEVSPEAQESRRVTLKAKTQEAQEAISPEAIATRKRGRQIRSELAELQLKRAEYEELTQPTPEQVKAERAREEEMGKLRLQLTDLGLSEAEAQAEQQLALEADWSRQKQQSLESLAGMIGPLPQNIVESVNALPYMGPQGQEVLASQMGQYAAAWAMPRRNDMMEDVSSWDEDETLAPLANVALQVVQRTNGGDPESVRNAEASLGQLRRNAKTVSEALSWANSDEVTEAIAKKQPNQYQLSGIVPGSDPRAASDAFKRFEYQWNDFKEMLMREPTVQNDGTVSYTHNPASVYRTMKAMAELDPTDDAAKAVIDAIVRTGIPGEGLEAGDMQFGPAANPFSGSTTNVSSAAMKSLDTTYEQLADQLGSKELEGRLSAVLEALEAIKLFSKGAASQRKIPDAQSFMEEIERLAGPDAALLLVDENGQLDAQRIYYVRTRLASQLKYDFKAGETGFRPVGR